MKHFLIEITYQAPLEEIDKVTPEHRAFLQQGDDSGLLLYSGRQVPPASGLILARAESQEALEMFFAGDPYRIAGMGNYRFVEFGPTKFQPFLQDWIAGE
jgi:uncharacterized protein YciI